MKLLTCIFLILSLGAYAQEKALHQLLYTIRDPKTQPHAFRKNLEKIGEYLALQVLEELDHVEADIETLTGFVAKHPLLSEEPVLITILRAGLPLNAGVEKVFPESKVGFLAMSRDEETLKAKTEYIALPAIENRSVILVDTMIGTGGSLLDAIQILEQHRPKQIFVIAAIASEPGITRILKNKPSVKIFAASIDPMLNEKGYICPGLGDAGDRAYGEKRVIKPE